ncbi:plasmid mobilization protein [Bradyrhizobium prioriisuperbiae]|uniref:plasmid mobilization protein n=1 Tax=Bradyrhizobium prioriisuperbiae TaxID=2854389 RepID=UPI0028EF9774|nr:plasmid mobilization relaxosome protein MobC [Bradyrhizobium prioritasuperba]
MRRKQIVVTVSLTGSEGSQPCCSGPIGARQRWVGRALLANLTQATGAILTASDDHAPRKKQWGRPRAIELRERIIKLRLTAAEAAAIQASAFASRLPVAIFVRRRALGQAIAAPAASVDIDVVASLGRIGNNLNQMARLAHEGRAPAAWPHDDIAALRDHLNSVASSLAKGHR